MASLYLKLFVDSLEKYQKLNDAEFGRLIRAALTYKANGEEVGLTGREDLLWDGMKLEIDRDNDSYAEICEARSAAGKKGAEVRWQKDGKNSNCHFANGKEWQKCQDKDKEEDKDKDKESNIPPNPPKGAVDPFTEFGGENAELRSVLSAFEEMRKKIRKPMTAEAKKLLVSKLRKYPQADWVPMLNEAILNSWQSVYPLKGDGRAGSTAKMLNDSYRMMEEWANG